MDKRVEGIGHGGIGGVCMDSNSVTHSLIIWLVGVWMTVPEQI